MANVNKLMTSAMDGVNVDNAGAIIDHIDVWTSAIKKRNATGRGSSKKIELTGIKKLRELILELAVRGKLVPQDSNDEPASVLLERIEREKAQLIADKKIKKQKPLPLITEEEKPFDIASGWEWVSFGAICEIERGGSPRPIKSFITEDEDGLNWIKIGDTDIGGKYITSTAEKITKEGLKKTREVYPGDFLLTNSMSFGRPYITKIKGCIHDGWLRISPPSFLDKDYLYSLLSSSFIIRAFKKSASGAVVMNLNAEKVRSVRIPLPPISEQHRIVAKVDELMILCDQLEQQTEQSQAAHQTLVEVLLAALLPSTSKSTVGESDSAVPAEESFQTSWQRISDHFDVLFTTEHSIEQLKQTILQLAVMGKLVPQNPNDEPASALLEKIAEEKAQLIADKNITSKRQKQKQKPLPAITDEDKPFVLPSSWEWARVGDLLSLKNGYAFKSKYFVENKSEYILATPGNFYEEGGFRHRGDKTKYYDGPVDSDFVFESGDLIIPMTEQAVGLLGSAAFVPKDQNKYLHNQRLGKLSPYSNSTTLEFIYLFFNSSFLRSELARTCTGMKVRHTSPDRILTVSIPVIPPKEQIRIVAKVDELMALCDKLKDRLSDAQITQLHLADAVVENALQGEN